LIQDKIFILAFSINWLEHISACWNPHFLFNSLNSIRAWMDENKSACKEMITELSEFLRYSLISTPFNNCQYELCVGYRKTKKMVLTRFF